MQSDPYAAWRGIEPTPHDREALERCLEAQRQEKGRAEQLDAMIAEGRPWFWVAKFAAACAQSRALNLRPDQQPPCVVGEVGEDPSEAPARALLARMIEAGLSRYEPDPLEALRRAGGQSRNAII